MLRSMFATHSRRRKLKQRNLTMFMEQRNQEFGRGQGRWHWWSADGTDHEQRMLQKVQELERSPEWKRNPVFGRSTFGSYLRINAGIPA